jgi:HD-GYP domain-containing protein (c-di-GMP phosphodiesterase class II)
MSDHDLRQIAEITAERSYRAGQFIVREHDRAERFFIIYRGKIEITKCFEDGEEVVLGIHSDGEFFGEMALLDEAPRAANARALEATRVFEITRQNFEVLLFKAPQLAFSIMRELSARLRETGALLVSYFQSKSRELAQAYLETLDMLIQATEARQGVEPGRSRRVRDLAVSLGRELKLSGPELYDLEISALLYDLGMMDLPRKILQKSGPLNAEETRQVRAHPGKTAELIAGISYLRRTLPAVTGHHERFDGTGYPDRKRGEGIPLAARILAVADAFVSLTADRPYRERRPPAAALEEIRGSAGGQFDPLVVAALGRIHAEPQA